MARRGSPIAAIAVILLVLVLGAPSLVYPFGTDQGQHAYAAEAALAGQHIYRDIADVGMPLTNIVHEVALVAFGHSMLSIRILDLLWQGATALAIMLIADSLLTFRGAGALAAFLYAAFYYFGGYWQLARADGFLTLPAALGVLAFVKARRQGWTWGYLACGAAIGAAMLFSISIGILLPFLLVPVLLSEDGRARRQALQLGAGLCIPLGVCALAMGAGGTLGDFVYSRLHSLPPYAHGPRSALVVPFLRLSWLEHNPFVWIPATVLVFEYARRKAGGTGLLIPGLWWAGALAGYALQGERVSYHTPALFAPAAVILAYVPFAAYQEARSRLARLGIAAGSVFAVLVLLLAALGRDYPCNYRALVQVALREKPLAALYQASVFREGDGLHSVREQMAAAAYIEAHSAPDDTVFVYGSEPAIYFLSRRSCASRYICSPPLYEDSGVGDHRTPGDAAVRTAILGKVERDIERSRPAYVAVVRHESAPWLLDRGYGSPLPLPRWPRFIEMAGAPYEAETAVVDLALYRRAAWAAPCGG